MKYARQLHVMLAWVALLALMLASLGSSYLPLGRWNLVIGLAIATLKSLIVLWLFMGLVRAPATLRMAAGLGFGALALLFFLSGVDFATRDVHPATMQQPRQLQVPPHRVGEASGLRESSSFLRRQESRRVPATQASGSPHTRG